MQIELNEPLFRKVLSLIDQGLVEGVGKPEPGKMCIEAVWCYALGQPHGDNPEGCVGPSVRRYKIRLNDSCWPNDVERAKGMRRLGIAQAGSDQIDQKAFREEVAFQGIRQILPIALREAGSLIPAHKDALETAAVTCEVCVDLASALSASRKARTVALNTRNAAAYAAADIYDTALDANFDTAAAVYDADAKIKVLSLAAEIAVQALIKLKCKGCEWLWLCDEVPA